MCEWRWTSVIVSDLIQIISINMVPCYSPIKYDISRRLYCSPVLEKLLVIVSYGYEPSSLLFLLILFLSLALFSSPLTSVALPFLFRAISLLSAQLASPNITPLFLTRRSREERHPIRIRDGAWGKSPRRTTIRVEDVHQ